MKAPAPADLRRWSNEVARDPGSLSFFPLAEFYRGHGQRDAALRLCLRGLERNPEHVGAHGLLARLYLESGDREKAFDEWGIVLRLDPENFEAHRGLGFCHLERGELARAREHLGRARAARPEDPLVREAWALVERRGAAQTAAAEPGPPEADGRASAVASPEARKPGERALPRDPTRLFSVLQDEAPFRGALLVDAHGLVLAGSLAGDGGARSEALGAVLRGTIEEAGRASELLRLGQWRGLLLHAREAAIHIAPIAGGHVVVLAAAREAPTGWILRSAHRAGELAHRFLEATRV